MTAPGFHVVTADLRTHADVASEVAGLLGGAHASGQQAVLGDDAFGRISVAFLFSALLKSAAGPAVDVLAQAAATMSSISRNVSMVAANYDHVDQTNAARFQPGAGTSTTGPSSPGSSSAGPTTGRSGGNIVNDVHSLEKDISSGNWVQAGLAGMNIVSDAVQILSDPVAAITQYGLGFLMNAIKPLHDAVTWLVGNPGQVASYGSSWQGVSQSVGQANSTFLSSLTTNTASWTGQAANNYRAYATTQSDALTAATTATRTLGSVTQSIGTLVGNVQNMIEQMVGRAMAQIIETALGSTFMITIPVIVAKVVNDVVSWMKRIADVINQLTSSLRSLQPLIGNLTQLVGSVEKVMSSGGRPVSAIGTRSVAGITLPPSPASVLPTFATR